MPLNLLSAPLSPAQLQEILARHPRRPLMPPLGSEPWNRVRANPGARRWLRPLRARAEAECAQPIPDLPDALYADFRATGRRLPFENVYVERRRRLQRAALALLLSEENDPWRERLTASLMALWDAVFSEVSWALPAHVNWDNEDPSGKEPLQIDLYGAETANLMAELFDLFSAVTPVAFQQRIRARLQTDIWENCANRAFHWKRATHNWNAVCHQGVIGAALSQLEDPRLLAELLLSARESLPLFLSGFGADGGCSEGVGYWSYGFGCFAILNEQLEQRTDGELSLFEGDEHVRRIACFGPCMAFSGGNLINFSDGAATGGLAPFLCAYLGARLSEPECLRAAAENYLRLADGEIDFESVRWNSFYTARCLLRFPEEAIIAGKTAKEDCFLPELGVLSAHGIDRSGHLWEFASKAGHNGEHHNHNDCGSFILNIDGVRVLTEIGSPEYVHDYFQPATRYGFLAARTLGHSLPILNGCEQAPGDAYASTVLAHSLTSEKAEFVVDARGCYPPEARCRKFVRRLELDKVSGRLLLEDDLEVDGSVEGALITMHPVQIRDGRAWLDAGGLTLQVSPGPETELDRVEAHVYRAHNGEEASINRLVFRPATAANEVRLRLEMSLV